MIKYNFDDFFIFEGLDYNLVNDIINLYPPMIMSYEKGSFIYGEASSEEKVGFVLCGSCEVRSVSFDGTYVPLNAINQHGSFGIISIFSKNNKFPTEIYAKTSTTIAFFSKESIMSIISDYPKCSFNIISFLANRVSFLNDKLSTFTAGSVERKLANYLLQIMKEQDSLEFPFNKKKSAEIINAGRASLYRALDALKDIGIIEFNEKNIKIISPEGLERI